MSPRFAVARWAAWAPGLVDQAAWLAWLAAPHPIAQDGAPPLAEMPAMMRRRVERLGRVALQAAYWAQGEAAPCPIVFASRYGDVPRSIELLRQLAADEPLSPTAFSMSVHNAFGALFSIARGDTTAYTAIAAGEETAESAFIEATSLLADGAPAVLVVYYDEPLPAPLRSELGPYDFPRAWACRVTLAGLGGISLSALAPSQQLAEPSDLPPDLRALRFLVADAPDYTRAAATRVWQWCRHV